MKKFCFLLICVLILPIFFVGCKEEDPNDGFVEVQSITYVVGDNSTTLHSTWNISITPHSARTTTEEDFTVNVNNYTWHPHFNKSEFITRFTNVYTKSWNMSEIKSNIPSFASGDLVYYCLTDNEDDTSYYKAVIEEVRLTYINVKIIDNNIIEIKSNEGQISRILCTSYKINYFI